MTNFKYSYQLPKFTLHIRKQPQGQFIQEKQVYTVQEIQKRSNKKCKHKD